MAWKPNRQDMLDAVQTLIQCRKRINQLIETKKMYTGDKGRLAELAQKISDEEDHLLVRVGRVIVEEADGNTATV